MIAYTAISLKRKVFILRNLDFKLVIQPITLLHNWLIKSLNLLKITKILSMYLLIKVRPLIPSTDPFFLKKLETYKTNHQKPYIDSDLSIK